MPGPDRSTRRASSSVSSPRSCRLNYPARACLRRRPAHSRDQGSRPATSHPAGPPSARPDRFPSRHSPCRSVTPAPNPSPPLSPATTVGIVRGGCRQRSGCRFWPTRPPSSTPIPTRSPGASRSSSVPATACSSTASARVVSSLDPFWASTSGTGSPPAADRRLMRIRRLIGAAFSSAPSSGVHSVGNGYRLPFKDG